MGQPKIKKDIEARIMDIGDTMTGNFHISPSLDVIPNFFMEVSNGQSGFLHIYKNASTSKDYGTNFVDHGMNGQILRLILSGNENKAQLRIQSNESDQGQYYTLLHSGNVGNYALPISGGTLTGQLKVAPKGGMWIYPLTAPQNNAIYYDASDASSSTYWPMLTIKFPNSTFSLGGERASNQFGIYAYNNTRTENGTDAGFWISGNDLNCYCSTKLYGAVWNDYAEYREFAESPEPPYGRVVIENGNDTLSLSTERLQPGGNICSDTYGFAIGQTDKCKMPIAVSGRVLAYPNEPRETYKPGEALCTGPNGTVSRMTREEIKEYPDRIIGYVSSIPEYEIWGTGNVEINGRIWVKIK